MTKEEAEKQVAAQGYCTPDLYQAIKGRPWDGASRFIWLESNLDIGYRIKYNPSHGGSQPNPASDRQRQPWVEQGISQATFYRRKAVEARWTSIFLELDATDTPANRNAYKVLASTAKVLGVPFRDLWLDYRRTLSSGESGTLLSSSESDNHDTLPPLPTEAFK